MGTELTSDITLADEGDHKADFPSGQDSWHQNLFTLVGSADGHERSIVVVVFNDQIAESQPKRMPQILSANRC